jgi:hypothetical protein
VTRGRARIHLDAGGRAPGDLRRAFCGWLDVDVATDVSTVDCKSCMARLASKRTGVATSRGSYVSTSNSSDVQAALAAAFRATLAPTASAPPRMTAPLWAASCKGGEHRRCGECDLCVWERDAQLWAAVSPWNRQHALERPADGPRWSSLAAALTALVEFDQHDRCSPSALGGILDRLQRGAAGDTGERSAVPDNALLRRAGELVRVRQALELAYPEGGHALPALRCRALLLVRTPGIADAMPSYEALAELLGTSPGDLQALVRSGRRIVIDELTARGLIPAARTNARRVVAATTHYAEAAE